MQGCCQVERGMCGFSGMLRRNEGIFWGTTKTLPCCESPRECTDTYGRRRCLGGFRDALGGSGAARGVPQGSGGRSGGRERAGRGGAEPRAAEGGRERAMESGGALNGSAAAGRFAAAGTAALGALMALLIAVTVAGNALVMLAFVADSSLRTQNNFFLLNLAISDFLVGKVHRCGPAAFPRVLPARLLPPGCASTPVPSRCPPVPPGRAHRDRTLRLQVPSASRCTCPMCSRGDGSSGEASANSGWWSITCCAPLRSSTSC